MKTGEHTNEFGVRVTEHECDTCGKDFTVTPGVDDWPNCLDEDCASYDSEREVDLTDVKQSTGPRNVIN